MTDEQKTNEEYGFKEFESFTEFVEGVNDEAQKLSDVLRDDGFSVNFGQAVASALLSALISMEAENIPASAAMKAIHISKMFAELADNIINEAIDDCEIAATEEIGDNPVMN